MTFSSIFNIRVFAPLALAALFLPARSYAADLKPQTLRAWEEYLKAVDARNQKYLVPGNESLSVDGSPEQMTKLREGEILVSPSAPDIPAKVPQGLIHDWIGTIFINDTTIPELLGVVRDYTEYKRVYHPYVLSSKPVTIGEGEDQYSLVLANRSVFARGALDFDYRTTYFRIDDQHWYSTTEATRIQEIADYGRKSERALPLDHGTGLIWRMYSTARFEERDGGVYVEVEALVLSRDIPGALRWLIEPIVRRISRSSLTTSLQQTEVAMRGSETHAPHKTSRAPATVVRSFK